MNLQSFLPHPLISNYVSSIFVMENCNLHSDAGLPLFANGYPAIAFQITDSGILSIGNEKIEDFVLYGQNTKPTKLYTSGHFTLITYFLYPHVLKTFFGFNANELTDLSIDLSFLHPAKEMNLKEQLLNATSLNTRLQLMNNYVLKLSETNCPGVNHAILFAAQTIRKGRGLLSLKNIQREINVSERTFRRLFEFHVGVSPKMFSRICQFDSAFQQLNQKKFTRLSDIAFENGYADQSHLIRSFKEFTNYSPKEYSVNRSLFLPLNP